MISLKKLKLPLAMLFFLVTLTLVSASLFQFSIFYPPPSLTPPPTIQVRPYPLGYSCSIHDDCLSNYCHLGVCTATKASGQTCQERRECTSFKCAGGICQSCSGDSQCGGDVSSSGIVYGSFCVSPTCYYTNLENGRLCFYDRSCQSGLCTNNYCSSSYTLALGASCQKDLQCSSAKCDPSTLKCVNVPLGSSCTDDRQCSQGSCLADSSGTKKCTLLPLGSQCTLDISCTSHKCAIDYTGIQRCVPSLNLGATCSSDNQCISGLCLSNICSASRIVVNGQTCQKNEQCVSGICSSGYCKSCATSDQCSSRLCSSGVCLLQNLANGQTCKIDSQCQSLFCLSGKCSTVASLPDGTSCVDSRQCSSQYCTSGKCAVKTSLSVGSSCTYNGQCFSGLCKLVTSPSTYKCQSCYGDRQCPSLTDKCVGGRCVAGAIHSLSLGSSCTSSKECATGLCTSSLCSLCTSNIQCAGQVCKDGFCNACLTNAECDSKQCVSGACSSLQPSNDCVILDARKEDVIDGLPGMFACPLLKASTYQCQGLFKQVTTRYYASKTVAKFCTQDTDCGVAGQHCVSNACQGGLCSSPCSDGSTCSSTGYCANGLPCVCASGQSCINGHCSVTSQSPCSSVSKKTLSFSFDKSECTTYVGLTPPLLKKDPTIGTCDPATNQAQDVLRAQVLCCLDR